MLEQLICLRVLLAYSWDIDTDDLMDMIETLIDKFFEVLYEKLFLTLAEGAWDFVVRLLQRDYFGTGPEVLLVLFCILIGGWLLIRRFD